MSNFAHEETQPLTIRMVASDLKSMPTLISTMVGAPTLLDLVKRIITDFRLITPFQWGLDVYHAWVGWVANQIEPWVIPIILWVNEGMGWHLVLYPHWRPLFLLLLILDMGVIRVLRHQTRDQIEKILIIIVGATSIFYNLILALLAGLVPVSSEWWQQGFGAGSLFALFYFTPLLLPALRDQSLVRRLMVGLRTTIAIFALAALLSLVPGLENNAYLLVLAGWVAARGFTALARGYFWRMEDPQYARESMRVGFTILGGFMFAALLLVADAVVKVLVSVST